MLQRAVQKHNSDYYKLYCRNCITSDLRGEKMKIRFFPQFCSTPAVGLHLHVAARSPKAVTIRPGWFVLTAAHLSIPTVGSGTASLPKLLVLILPLMNKQGGDQQGDGGKYEHQKHKEKRFLPPPVNSFLIWLLQEGLVCLLLRFHWTL